MITLYSGTPGSGKSLHAAEKIVSNLKLGYSVLANFDVNRNYFKTSRKDYFQKFHYVDNGNLTPAFLLKYSREYYQKNKFKENGIILYIDEAQLLFNAREWSQAGRAEWLSFFTQHRKYGYNIVLIAQFDRMLDRQLRSLIEYEDKHRKVENAGMFAWFLTRFVGGRLFAVISFWYPVREKVGVSFKSPKKKLFTFYDSYRDFGDSSAVSLGGELEEEKKLSFIEIFREKFLNRKKNLEEDKN